MSGNPSIRPGRSRFHFLSALPLIAAAPYCGHTALSATERYNKIPVCFWVCKESQALNDFKETAVSSMRKFPKFSDAQISVMPFSQKGRNKEHQHEISCTPFVKPLGGDWSEPRQVYGGVLAGSDEEKQLTKLWKK